jgi:hypothetical protein
MLHLQVEEIKQTKNEQHRETIINFHFHLQNKNIIEWELLLRFKVGNVIIYNEILTLCDFAAVISWNDLKSVVLNG